MSWPSHIRKRLAARSGWRMRVLACWLALLVVLAPTLGRMHGVLHLPPAVVLAQGLAVSAQSDHVPAQGRLAALFQHHAVLDCWEFEQLGHAHDLPVFLWLGPAPQPIASPAWQPHAMPAAAPQRLFQARAPPASCVA